MKRTIVIAVFAALMGSLYGQSVSDLAKQEKARRAALGANRAKVVTNADLAAVRKTPAVVVGNPDEAQDQNQPTVLPSGEPSGADAGGVVMNPTVIKNGPELFNKAESGPGADTAARLKAAEELVDLLTTKLNALMQQSNSLDTMTPKDAILQQIEATTQKLQRVQDEVARLKGQAEAGKQGGPEKR